MNSIKQIVTAIIDEFILPCDAISDLDKRVTLLEKEVHYMAREIEHLHNRRLPSMIITIGVPFQTL